MGAIVIPGTCSSCGCTDDRACVTDDGPCFWVDPERTLCSACEDLDDEEDGDG